MRTHLNSPHTIRLSLSAGILALLLSAMPLAVHADELTPAESPSATQPADALPVDEEESVKDAGQTGPTEAVAAVAEPSLGEPAVLVADDPAPAPETSLIEAPAEEAV